MQLGPCFALSSAPFLPSQINLFQNTRSKAPGKLRGETAQMTNARAASSMSHGSSFKLVPNSKPFFFVQSALIWEASSFGRKTKTSDAPLYGSLALPPYSQCQGKSSISLSPCNHTRTRSTLAPLQAEFWVKTVLVPVTHWLCYFCPSSSWSPEKGMRGWLLNGQMSSRLRVTSNSSGSQ